MATDRAVHDALRLSPMFPLKSTPKKNILLPLNRFRTPYQNPLQQCNTYHTTPSIPHHPIFYISLSNYLFPSTTTRPIFVLQQQRGQELPGTEGDGERDERRRERQWRALGLWRATSKCAGSDTGYRWSRYRVIPPSIFRAPGRFQCTVVHSLSSPVPER